MTLEELQQLPDRELDALIAEKVMGWRWYAKGERNAGDPRKPIVWHCFIAKPSHVEGWGVKDVTEEDPRPPRFSDWDRAHHLPLPSSEIIYAFGVVGKMTERGFSFASWDCPSFSSVGAPGAMFALGVHPPRLHGDGRKPDGMSSRKSLPRCICEAALLAIQSITETQEGKPNEQL